MQPFPRQNQPVRPAVHLGARADVVRAPSQTSPARCDVARQAQPSRPALRIERRSPATRARDRLRRRCPSDHPGTLTPRLRIAQPSASAAKSPSSPPPPSRRSSSHQFLPDLSALNRHLHRIDPGDLNLTWHRIAGAGDSAFKAFPALARGRRKIRGSSSPIESRMAHRHSRADLAFEMFCGTTRLSNRPSYGRCEHSSDSTNAKLLLRARPARPSEAPR
jgi:hypothetical protein